MNCDTAPARSSHTHAWMLALLAVLPLLYLLTLPPLAILADHFFGNPFAKRLVQWDDLPAVATYGYPYRWLSRQSLFEKPLDAYAQWWMKVSPL